MPDPTAPTPDAPAAGTPPDGGGDAFDRILATVAARREEAAVAEGKAPANGAAGARTAAGASGAGATPGSPASSAGATPGAGTGKPRAADLGALAQREHQARQLEQQARTLAGKYQPIDEALSKKDLVGALTVIAEKHGFTFADFVAAMSANAPAEKTPAEIAAETVATKLAERDEAAAKERDEATKRDIEAREQATRQGFVQQAEAGTPEDPNRWELTHLAGAAGTAWDVIWGHYQATARFDEQGRMAAEGEKLSREQALDLIETKLKEKQQARRAKQTTATDTAAGNGRNEAAGQRTDGRAAAPSFTNRATSGMPAVVGAHPVDELGLPDNEAIDRIASRLGMRL